MSTRAAPLLVTLALAVGLVAGATPAGAASAADPDPLRLRAEIDDVAAEAVAAEIALRHLDAEIGRLGQQVDDLAARRASLREQATARAVELYKGSRPDITTVLGASDPIDSARRVRLVDRANQEGDAAIAALAAVSEQLDEHRAELDDARRAQDDALATLAERAAALDARLQRALAASAARAREAERAAASTTAPSGTAPSAPGPTPATSPADEPAAPARSDTPDTATPAPPPTRPDPPPTVDPPPPPTGTHPRHQDPFLVCTRSRESSGDYGAYNPAGPGYYGAYQFAPSTWDATAVHAGRPELVGVLPNRASAWDQDDLAWALYQWQGKAPWLHRC